MKRLMSLRLWILAALILPIFGGSALVAAQNTQDFDIVSFEADYYLGRDANKASTLKVVETIVAEFPAYDQNKGILRAIPQSYQDHKLSLNVESVEKAGGGRWNYSTSNDSNNLVLRIGDADRYVRGRQTYVITYTMRNVTAIFNDHEELYWDINGDQWQQTFGSVVARIHLADEIAMELQDRRACYAGVYGSVDAKGCVIDRMAASGETLVTASTRNLAAGENLSVVLGFNKGTFVLDPEIAAKKRREQLLIIAAVSAVVLPPLYTVGWAYRRWRKLGRDPEGRGVIVPEYQPPKGFNAVTASAILNEHVEDKAVSALMIELAVSKYLRIYEIPKKGLFGKVDYQLEVIKDSQDLSAEQVQALNMFFDKGATVGQKVKLSTLSTKLSTEMNALSAAVDKQLYEQGYFVSNPDKARSSYVRRGAVLMAAGVVIGFLGFTLPLSLGLVLSGGLLMLLRNIMPARTALGVTAREHILGLKDYMKLAEADRIRFLQSPAGAEKIAAGLDPADPKQQVKLFEKLLPYAMLFGIEKDWAKQFKDLYTQPPDWYSGNWSTFNAIHLASSLGGFNSVSAASFASPSSSGSTGFGGGGFSGGGGGGGGGW